MSKNPKVLVVEDNFMNMMLVKEILEVKGYEIIEATDGAQALVMVKSERPDLVLMDINLPIMDGVAVMKALKKDESTSMIPVLALTASAMKGDAERFIGEGFDGYVAKPIDMKKLLESVEKGLALVG